MYVPFQAPTSPSIRRRRALERAIDSTAFTHPRVAALSLA